MTTTATNPRLAAALLYASLGWPVLPLHTPDEFGVCDCPRRADCESTGKHPRVRHGVDDATLDPERITRLWTMWPQANIGIDLERSDLVDIAPDSIEWFAEFTARGLPPTLRFASGGGEGHAHHLYARPDDCAAYRDPHSGEYDILSKGYAVMPPSLHWSQRVYTWIEPVDGVILHGPDEPSPKWAVDVLNAKGRRREAPPEERDEDAPPVDLRGDARERWYGRLYEVSQQHGGVDRSYSLWRMATVLLEAGCTPAFAQQLIAERDAALGWTKFTARADAHVRYRVIVARAVAGRGPGRVRRQGKTRAAGPEARESKQRSLVWLNGATLADVVDESLAWFIHGWLGGGLISELDGKVKASGKTTLVLAMVRAILYGEPFLEQATTYTPVVYLTEQSGTSFKRSCERAGVLGRGDFHILLYSETAGWEWNDIVVQAIAYALLVGARVLIIDTLAQFSGVRGDSENSSGSAMGVMDPLHGASKAGLAVLLNRHDRKSGGDVGDSGRGSSAYAGAVDIILHLSRVPNAQPGHERERLIEGLSRFEETPDKVLIALGADPPLSYHNLGDPEEVRDRVLRVEILRVLPLHAADALTADEVVEIVGARDIDVRRALRQLLAEQLINRTGHGKKGDPHRFFQTEGSDD